MSRTHYLLTYLTVYTITKALYLPLRFADENIEVGRTIPLSYLTISYHIAPQTTCHCLLVVSAQHWTFWMNGRTDGRRSRGRGKEGGNERERERDTKYLCTYMTYYFSLVLYVPAPQHSSAVTACHHHPSVFLSSSVSSLSFSSSLLSPPPPSSSSASLPAFSSSFLQIKGANTYLKADLVSWKDLLNLK